MVPVLLAPGDCTVTAAVGGSPVTARVTLPVVPVRVSVTLTVALACDGKASGELLESETVRLPVGVMPPPLLDADPPQLDIIKRERKMKKNHVALLFMSA